jgi:sporulation protein YlmC with PRC-barrel domain
MNEDQDHAKWSAADWHCKMLVDRDGEKIGKLQDVYVDAETDEPQFGTVKEGFIDRHLIFVPLGGIHIGPDDPQVEVTKEQVRSVPGIEMHGEELSQAGESALYEPDLSAMGCHQRSDHLPSHTGTKARCERIHP